MVFSSLHGAFYLRGNMIRALLRFLLFEMPIAFVTGLTYILFDWQEIIQTQFRVLKQWRPDMKKRYLADYLNQCYKQVHEDEKQEDEKRLDKD